MKMEKKIAQPKPSFKASSKPSTKPASKPDERKIRQGAKPNSAGRQQAANRRSCTGVYNKAYDEAYDKGFNDGYTKGLEDGKLDD